MEDEVLSSDFQLIVKLCKLCDNHFICITITLYEAVDDSHSIDFTQMSLLLNSRYAWLVLKKKMEPFIHAGSSQPYVSTFKSAWIQREWKYWRKRGAAPEGININIMARNSGKLKPIMSAWLVRSRKSFCFLSLPRALNMHCKKEFRDRINFFV